ncbi:MAG: hypothetical protein FWD16_01640 [Clostridia bacterium]|nr:hypothetical protein [Clostridia bacterium]
MVLLNGGVLGVAQQLQRGLCRHGQLIGSLENLDLFAHAVVFPLFFSIVN